MLEIDAALTGAVAAVLCAWFLASIPTQFRWRWWESLSRHDALGLLPRWTFFAPNPGRHDLHLLVRDWIDGEPSPWREFERLPPPPLVRALWNPGRFARKTITDVGNAVVRSAAGRVDAAEENAKAIQLHAAYLEILGWVTAAGRHERAVGVGEERGERQFALVRTQTDQPGRRLQVVFLSFLHPLT